jgi:hypothetical protein
VIYNGPNEPEIKPGKASFHLMVTLNEAKIGVAIPQSTVGSTITNREGVYDERQRLVVSRYIGRHCGNDVAALPGAGSCQLSFLVSPPESATHAEYADVWLHPHRANFMFRWRSAS